MGMQASNVGRQILFLTTKGQLCLKSFDIHNIKLDIFHFLIFFIINQDILQYIKYRGNQKSYLPIVGPRAAVDPGGHLVLLHRLLLAGPEAEVAVGAGGELVGDGVVGQALDGVVVRVLQDALQLARPDDHAFVGTT